MLHGFSNFNKIEVRPHDQFKTIFTTPWGTFTYNRVLFGIINAGAIFQRVMNSSFVDLKEKIIIVYLDSLTSFSKRREDHFIDFKRF